MITLTGKDLIRFESKIDYDGRQTPYVATRCHEWIGKHNGSGYCQIKINGKEIYVHILAKMHYHGWAPDPNIPRRQQHCSHLCGVRRCVNPDHIEVVSASKNNQHKVMHGTHQKGKLNGMTEITEGLARKIKLEVFAPGFGEYGDVTNLAFKYDVSKHIIYHIKYEKCWAWLPKYPPIFEDE